MPESFPTEGSQPGTATARQRPGVSVSCLTTTQQTGRCGGGDDVSHAHFNLWPKFYPYESIWMWIFYECFWKRTSIFTHRVGNTVNYGEKLYVIFKCQGDLKTLAAWRHHCDTRQSTCYDANSNILEWITPFRKAVTLNNTFSGRGVLPLKRLNEY